MYSRAMVKSMNKKRCFKKGVNKWKKYILECRCKWLDVENNSLEHYLNADSWNYGMNCKDELLKLGFTKQDMDAFILDRYEELVKQKEEDEDD